MIKKDAIGQDVEIGDIIAYSRTGQKLNMEHGQVVKFTPKGFSVRVPGCAWSEDGFYEWVRNVRVEGTVKIFNQEIIKK